MADSREYNCEGCDQVFSSKTAKEDHFETVHLGIWACDECSDEFNNELKRNVHIMSKHRTIQKHQCENCEESFKYKVNLNDHLTKEHGHVLGQECEECGELFFHVDALTKHLDEVHSKLSEYTCPGHCTIFFPIKDDLVRHLVDVEKLTCQECGQIYSYKYNLHRHIRNVHEQERRGE